jgi:hypothetical protein
MKKKSFEVTWEWAVVSCGFFSLLVIFTFSLRTVLLPGSYGAVSLEIPVLGNAVADPGYHRYREEPRHYLSKLTPTVVLTAKAFYFGSLSAFSEDYATSHNKYQIPHKDGSPLLGLLIESVETWLRHRSKNENVPIDKILVLIPMGEIPVPIVTQVVNEIKKSALIDRVILGSGIE